MGAAITRVFRRGRAAEAYIALHQLLGQSHWLVVHSCLKRLHEAFPANK